MPFHRTRRAQPSPDQPAHLPATAHRRRWCWVQFVCAFLFCGFIAFLHVGAPDGWGLHLLKTLMVASVGGLIAGRFGDSAWGWILNALWWS